MSGQWSHGKGDTPRQSGVPHEVYGLKYDLATGKITQKEYDAQIDVAWAKAKKRGWY